MLLIKYEQMTCYLGSGSRSPSWMTLPWRASWSESGRGWWGRGGWTGCCSAAATRTECSCCRDTSTGAGSSCMVIITSLHCTVHYNCTFIVVLLFIIIITIVTVFRKSMIFRTGDVQTVSWMVVRVLSVELARTEQVSNHTFDTAEDS